MTEKEIDNTGEKETVDVTPEMDNSPEAEKAKLDQKALRHAQQMEWAKKEVERLEAIALEAQVKLAEKDASNLLELYKTDPKLAEKVSQRFGYSSFNEAKSTIKSWEVIEKKVVTADDFDTLYERRRSEERHQEALEDVKTFFSKSKLSDDESEKAQIYFNKITEWRKLTISDAREFAEMATLYVQKEKIKEGKYQEWLKELSSTWVTTSKKPTQTKEEDKTIVRDGRVIVLNSNK